MDVESDSTAGNGGNEPGRPMTLEDAIAVARDRASKPGEEWWTVTAEVLTILADAAERAPEPPQGEARPDQAALNSLRTYQRQIDEDGVQVGVSREALDHVLDWIDRAYLSQASGEGGLREGVLPPSEAEDHGCRERASDEQSDLRSQKQRFKHDPTNGVWGDCHRTAIACALGVPRDDVPHFCEGGKNDANKRVDEWLAQRGLCQISLPYGGDVPLKEVLRTQRVCNRGIYYLLGGTSRTGVGHTVLCLDDRIIHDPSLTASGIVGPMEDGNWWLTFFGTAKAAAPVDATEEQGFCGHPQREQSPSPALAPEEEK